MKIIPFIVLLFFAGACSYFITRQIMKYKEEKLCRHELADKLTADLADKMSIKNAYEKKIKHYMDLKDIYEKDKTLFDNTLALII